MTHVRTVFCHNCPLHIIKINMQVVSNLRHPTVTKMLLLGLCYPFVLCGCETWSFTLKEECGLRVFENWVLRRIFGPKRDEVTGQ
jgi:hypothetical protein